jgi:hypothetical protein
MLALRAVGEVKRQVETVGGREYKAAPVLASNRGRLLSSHIHIQVHRRLGNTYFTASRQRSMSLETEFAVTVTVTQIENSRCHRPGLKIA